MFWYQGTSQLQGVEFTSLFLQVTALDLGPSFWAWEMGTQEPRGALGKLGENKGSTLDLSFSPSMILEKSCFAPPCLSFPIFTHSCTDPRTFW